MLKKWKGLFLALLFGAYPIAYLYSQNAKVVEFTSFLRILLFAIIFAILIYSLFFLIKRDALYAGFGAAGFLLLFFIYGYSFDFLTRRNWITIAHYTLLPIFFVAMVYGLFILSKINNKTLASIQSAILVIVGGLLVFNSFIIVQAQVKKALANSAQNKPPAQPVVASNATAGKKYPDIYYFLFDEYAGFDAIHEYFKADDVDHLKTFLEQHSFYVADKSRSDTTNTLVEMASRLNMKKFHEGDDLFTLFNAISQNKVFALAKSYGYTTVAFDTTKFMYTGKTPIVADFNLMYDSKSMTDQQLNIDPFTQMVFDDTMLRVFSKSYHRNDDLINTLRNSVLYPLHKVTDLKEAPSPRIVYAHLLLPHYPFTFDENGGRNDYKYYPNWNYYLGQHKFATKQMEMLVTNLLANADPDNPPIIILQSDHGARNVKDVSPDSVILENYPDKYKFSILNAFYLPGYDTAQLKQDFSPYDVFPLIFQHYFGMDENAK